MPLGCELEHTRSTPERDHRATAVNADARRETVNFPRQTDDIPVGPCFGGSYSSVRKVFIMTRIVYVDRTVRRNIWDQWRLWEIITLDPDIETEMFRFYDWLKEARPQLLDWQFEDNDREIDKWEIVHEWLRDYERKHPRL